MGSIDRSRQFIICVITSPCSDNIVIQTGRQQTEVFGSQENNSFIKHPFGFFAPILNSTSCLYKDFNILCKYEWPSIRWSWSVTDGENFHLHSCVVYSSPILPPCDLDDLLVGNSQARQNVLPVSTSSCGSSSGNNHHRWISQGTRVQLVSPDVLRYTYRGWK